MCKDCSQAVGVRSSSRSSTLETRFQDLILPAWSASAHTSAVQRQVITPHGWCQSARTWEPVRTAPLARSQLSALPRDLWTFKLNALRSDGVFLEAWHRNCPSRERNGKDPMLSMTGVGAYPAQARRMHAVATCVCTNVLYEKKSAMVYVPPEPHHEAGDERRERGVRLATVLGGHAGSDRSLLCEASAELQSLCS